MTIKDFLEGAVPGTVRLRLRGWATPVWFAPYFPYQVHDGVIWWRGLNERGGEQSFPQSLTGWELWKEPKSPVVRWKWATYFGGQWSETTVFYSEEEWGKTTLAAEYSTRKLPHTRMEFDK